MTQARTRAVALIGVEGHLIELEAYVGGGLPTTILVGLPDSSVRETRDRVRAAIVNSKLGWPDRKITVGLSPASLPKWGGGFDLAIAAAILAAAEAVPLASVGRCLFLAELGLDGSLRPVPGVLPAVVAAAGDVDTVVVAGQNAAEAALVPGVHVVGAGTLGEVVTWLRGGQPPSPPAMQGSPSGFESGSPNVSHADLADVPGQPEARRALEVCAAGGHNLSLLGPLGAGKTMLAERLPSILPPLESTASMEVSSIYSIAGMFRPETGLITEPPFCAPHHTVSMPALVGGGSHGVIRPGVASLAHRGVLFLDQAPEFSRATLDALRQPLEAGEVIIARQAKITRFPAKFMLVLAASLCPCAHAKPSGQDCGCTPGTRRKYLARLSGPLLDRIDVKVALRPASRSTLRSSRQLAESSAVVAERVAAARERSAARLAGTPWRLNAEIPDAEMRKSFSLSARALVDLDRAVESGQVSRRGASKIRRIAWTLADLGGKDRPGAEEVNRAMDLWRGAVR